MVLSSFVDDTDSEFLRFRMHEIGNKMNKIRQRLGLRPRPRWGSLRRSPRPPSRVEGDRRLRRLHSRAFGTRLGACGASVLPYHLYVRGAASATTTIIIIEYSPKCISLWRCGFDASEELVTFSAHSLIYRCTSMTFEFQMVTCHGHTRRVFVT